MAYLKNHKLEKQIFFNRVIVVAVFMIFLLGLLVTRLFIMQVIQFNEYHSKSIKNQTLTVPVLPSRGLIYDRNGNILATNTTAYSLELIPVEVSNIDNTILELKKIISISDDSIVQFKKQIKFRSKYQSTPIKLKLTEDELTKFSLNRHRFPGVDIYAQLVRSYPHNDLFSHVIGYVGPITEEEQNKHPNFNFIGKNGLEKVYNHKMNGKIGNRYIERDAKGRIIKEIGSDPASPGEDLHLTIDLKLQKIAKEALGKQNGACVAIDPKTGEILALVSTPSFDPNLFLQGINEVNYKKLTSNKNQPLFNRVTQGRYSPGSLVKPALALFALDENVIDDKYEFTDNKGWYKLNNDDRLYRDWKKGGHGIVNVSKAIIQSCTTFFYELANKIGIDNIEKVYRSFGFGNKTLIDLDQEYSGFVPSIKWKQKTFKEPWFPGETLSVGIGQSYLSTTPIQIARYIATIANTGSTPNLHLLKSDTSKLEKTINIKNNKNWRIIKQAMVDTTQKSNGTAYYKMKQFFSEPVAGKTGTVQVYTVKGNETYSEDKIPKKLHDHSWFMGYAPIESPQIAIAAIVENSKGEAVSVSAKVLKEYFNNEK